MKRLYNAALVYMILGLGSGLFYREMTKAYDYSPNDFTQLSTLHTHFFALGMLVMLIVLALEKLFAVSTHRKLFGWFFWMYNGGLLLTTAIMVWHGMLQVQGKEGSPMISGFAGLGHMFLTAALIVFFIALGRSIKASDNRIAVEATRS